MLKAKNNVIYSADQEYLKRLAEESRYIGRECKLYEDRLVVFALPQNSKKKRKDEQRAEDKAERFSKRERNFGYARD